MATLRFSWWRAAGAVLFGVLSGWLSTLPAQCCSEFESQFGLFGRPGFLFGLAIIVALALFGNLSPKKLLIIPCSTAAYFAAVMVLLGGGSDHFNSISFALASAAGAALLLLSFHLLCQKIRFYYFVAMVIIMAVVGATVGHFFDDAEGLYLIFIGWQGAMMFMLAWIMSRAVALSPRES